MEGGVVLFLIVAGFWTYKISSFLNAHPAAKQVGGRAASGLFRKFFGG